MSVKNNMKRLLNFFTALIFLFFTGCSSSLTIKAQKDSSAHINLETDIGTTVASLITNLTESLNAFGMGDFFEQNIKPFANMQFFYAPQIKAALSTGDITDIEVSTPSATSVSISGTLPPPSKQKTSTSNGIKIANFVTCTQSSLTVILSPSTVRKIYDILSDDTKASVDLLMAPVFTGEQMSENEYKELIISVYGEDISKELLSSEIKITLEVPEGCTLKKSSLSQTENSKTAKDKAVFNIPLIEFLTLQEAKTFSITW